MFREAPSPEQLAGLGLSPDDFVAETFDVFPENETAVRVFQSVSTQWRVGPHGVYGLDYNVLPFIFDTHKIPKSKRAALLDDLRIMEDAAIACIRSNK